MEYIYGKNSVKEIIDSKQKIYEIKISDSLEDKELKKIIKEKGIKCTYLEKRELDRLVDGNHQGVVAIIDDFKYTTLDEVLNKKVGLPFLIILDHLEDPHNIGAIIRTADAVGADGIIIPKDRSVKINSTVFKTSVGAAFHVPICMVSNLNNTIKILKDKGIWIVGTAVENSVKYTEVDYDMPVAIVIGNEGQGMSRLIEKNCDFLVNIPMHGEINSLNASVAAGIMLYEVERQRNK